jgi:pseudouridine-5'-phosphate glycosidase
MIASARRGARRPQLHLRSEIGAALRKGAACVALESAVLSHGLPQDDARRLASSLDRIVRKAGATPALVAVRDGQIVVGADPHDLGFLFERDTLKLAERDLGVAVAARRSGGTTVAATLALADRIGIAVLATGGIGGVHLDRPYDVSADLHALAGHPVVVVCAGAKIICDMERTVEALDTLGVPIIGYRTDFFPAFLVRSSGIALAHRVETAAEIVAIQRERIALGARSALLVVQPAPAALALDTRPVEGVIAAAVRRAHKQKVRGPALTPYLLAAIADATQGRSLRANIGLLEANAALAASVAVAVALSRRRAG